MIHSMFVKKKTIRLNSIFLGEIVETEDFEGANRVKVKLFGITDTIPKSKLPYYSLKTEISDSPNANIRIPPIGATVEVEIKDDILNGVVISNLTNIAPK